MKLLSLITPNIRAYLLGAVGVLAITSVGAVGISYLQIQRQNEIIGRLQDRNKDLVEANAEWARNAQRLSELWRIEQQHVAALNVALTAIETSNTQLADQVSELEKSNAEVKEFLSRRIPDDLRRVLNQK